mmetsp:Transcript_38903/g.98652  ORF Transcript_38903/g.98652 Transcript_38903/m.98652 type:complete len:266 (-) Transcript_38903:66-863(-)
MQASRWVNMCRPCELPGYDGPNPKPAPSPPRPLPCSGTEPDALIPFYGAQLLVYDLLHLLLWPGDRGAAVAIPCALRRGGALRLAHRARALRLLRLGRLRLGRVAQSDVHLVVLHLGHEPIALVEQLAQPLDAERAELELLLELVAVQRLQPVPVDQVRMLRLADQLDDTVLHLVKRRRVVLHQAVDVPLVTAALDAGAGQQVPSSQHLPEVGLPGQLHRVQRRAVRLLVHFRQVAAEDARRGRCVVEQLEDTLFNGRHHRLQPG